MDSQAKLAVVEKVMGRTGSRGKVTQVLTFQGFILGACWYLLHLMISIVHVASQSFQVVMCYLISTGLWKKYQVLGLEKLPPLAIVFDDDEVKHFSAIIHLLNWISNFGVRNVILHDKRGVLKNSVSALEKLNNLNIIRSNGPEAVAFESISSREKLSVELLSWSDGKEAVAKAASLICSEYCKYVSLDGDNGDLVITEADVTNALKATGFRVSEPELLLVFGPVRSHLGFPPWRMRYTEIIHMGALESLRYSALVKAFYDFSTKSQNYGKYSGDGFIHSSSHRRRLTIITRPRS